ncbi:MAG: right-handed parallel beta-helix repeat-containing protein, partial [Thermoplasmata archaeon]
MNKKKIAVLLLSLTIILGFIVIIVEIAPHAKANTIYVPTDYTTIQAAIDAADPGDTVYVYNGTYYENVNVYKTINLTGENRNTTIIDGGGWNTVEITADWVNITGFTVTNGDEGIYFESSSNNIIADNNVISNDHQGIFLTINSNYNTIADNTASNNSDSGIYISFSNYNTIINNIASNNRYGIQFHDSSSNTLVNNQMIGNGIHIWGPFLNGWNTHNIDTSNTVNGKPVYYWKNQNGGTIPSGAGQVILANCQNILIENQDVSGGSVGIELGFSNNNNIVNNTASSNNMYGIHLCFSDFNTLTINNASNNGANGFYFYCSGNNILTN